MSEQEIENEIQAKNLDAPRLSPEKIDAVIADAAGRKAVGAVFENLPQSQTPKSTGRFG